MGLAVDAGGASNTAMTSLTSATYLGSVDLYVGDGDDGGGGVAVRTWCVCPCVCVLDGGVGDARMWTEVGMWSGVKTDRHDSDSTRYDSNDAGFVSGCWR